MDQIKIGNFISFLRKEQNLTQRELAERLGVTDRAVSKWENGRGLPDLSLLVPLCEALGISVNELLCGERIEREDLPEKAQDIVLDALTDSQKRVRHTKWRLLAVLAAIVLVFVCLAAMFGVDVNRMRNNEPILFSTWGIDYFPPVDLRDEKIEQAIVDVMMAQGDAEIKDLHPADSKSFVAIEIFLIEEKTDHLLVHTWVIGSTCYAQDEKILTDGGYSMPYRFTVVEEDGIYTVTKKENPRDGGLYAQDMEALFPASVRRDMERVYRDGTSERLHQKIEEQAKLYFHVS